MKGKSLILILVMMIFGLGQPAFAEHIDKRGYHQSSHRYHNSPGQRVKHRFHRKHVSYRSHRRPRYVKRHYYDYGHGYHGYHRYYGHRSHRIDAVVAGVVLGTLVYALHD